MIVNGYITAHQFLQQLAVEFPTLYKLNIKELIPINFFNLNPTSNQDEIVTPLSDPQTTNSSDEELTTETSSSELEGDDYLDKLFSDVVDTNNCVDDYDEDENSEHCDTASSNDEPDSPL